MTLWTWRRRRSAALLHGTAVVAAATFVAMLSTSAQEWTRPDSPFVIGEAYPEVPATCETVKYWIDHAPETSDRVSFAIKGELVHSEFDGALAYLIMCDEAEVQVLCVAYSNDDRNVGDTVLFGGGYSRVGERQIMLDPCLAGKE